MAHFLFVSYAREDAETVDGISDRLKWQGFSIWIDRSALRFGEWSRKIESAITECRAMVVMLSENSVRSQWVMKEVTMAGRLSKPVVPVSLMQTDIPQYLQQIVDKLQYVPYDGNPDVCANLVAATLSEIGLRPELLDETDPDLLEARRLFNSGQCARALKLYERIIEERPLHLVAVMDAVGSYYNAGHARVLQEENQGIRPPDRNEMVPEFRAAERIATRYINKDTGRYDRLFKARLWISLGMLASFVGQYDAAFKRFFTALRANPENPRIQQYIDRLRVQFQYLEIIRSSERMRSPFPFPEPNEYATWHTIAFPFTVTITPSLQARFPDDLPDDWRRLWLIDHNIGQLERLDTGENVLRELTYACEYLGMLSDTWFAELATKRIVGAITGVRTEAGRSKMPGLLPPGKSREKDVIASAFKKALNSLSDHVNRASLLAIWNSTIDHKEYLIDGKDAQQSAALDDDSAPLHHRQ